MTSTSNPTPTNTTNFWIGAWVVYTGSITTVHGRTGIVTGFENGLYEVELMIEENGRIRFPIMVDAYLSGVSDASLTMSTR